MSAEPALVVAAVDFGWGSAGKLDAILAALSQARPPRLIVLGSGLGRPVLCDLVPEAWYDEWPADESGLRALLGRHDVAAGLVVLDPEAATRIEAARTPCVYVDSLPYLWTDADPLPTTVSAYCAQTSLGGGPTPRTLRRVENLIWVGPITKPVVPAPRDDAVAVVNLGGLHSPGHPCGNPAYLRLVLPAAVHALRAAGARDIHVCGNVGAAEVIALVGDDAITSVGPRGHDDFLALTSRAGVLVTSPGLTTLLESLRARTPLACLPPQNVSQILNAEQFAAAAGPQVCVGWPPGVLDLDEVETARGDGELAALKVMSDAFDGVEPSKVHPVLSARLAVAIAHSQTFGSSARHPSAGQDGAAEVAAIAQGLLRSAAR